MLGRARSKFNTPRPDTRIQGLGTRGITVNGARRARAQRVADRGSARAFSPATSRRGPHVRKVAMDARARPFGCAVGVAVWGEAPSEGSVLSSGRRAWVKRIARADTPGLRVPPCSRACSGRRHPRSADTSPLDSSRAREPEHGDEEDVLGSCKKSRGPAERTAGPRLYWRALEDLNLWPSDS